MSKVFISYSSLDKQFVTRFAHDLIIADIPVWLDSYELNPGDSLSRIILGAMNESSFVISVVSRNYNKSVWTSREFNGVLKRESTENKKYLVPVTIDDTPVPRKITDRLVIDFRTDYNDKLKNLVRFFKREKLIHKSIGNTPVKDRYKTVNYIVFPKDFQFTIIEQRYLVVYILQYPGRQVNK
jgi:hypothetical protein